MELHLVDCLPHPHLFPHLQLRELFQGLRSAGLFGRKLFGVGGPRVEGEVAYFAAIGGFDLNYINRYILINSLVGYEFFRISRGLVRGALEFEVIAVFNRLVLDWR